MYFCIPCSAIIVVGQELFLYRFIKQSPLYYKTFQYFAAIDADYWRAFICM